jgi:hypothetical protein
MERLALFRMRASAGALALAVAGWAAGCAGPQAMIEPAFAQRTYTPARIAILPPAVFMVYDEVGDNDPQKSGALGQAVSQNTVRLISEELRRRGYEVNLQSRWDGIYDQNGQLMVSGYDLGWLANSIVQFANSDTGGGQGPMKTPSFVAPELAQRVGWATQSDALLYVNMKGVVVSEGKRTAQVVGVVFFVVVIAAIIALMIAQSKGGGHGDNIRNPGGGGGGTPSVPRAGGGATAAVPPVSTGAGAPTQAVVAAPRGRGSYGSYGGGGGRVYRSQPRVSSGVHVGVGVGVVVPIDNDVYTNDGRVADEDEAFAGDEIHVSLTLVSAYDGRVLWHIRDSVDVEADKPQELESFVRRYVGMVPPSLAAGAAPSPPSPPSAPAAMAAPPPAPLPAPPR